MPFSKRPSSRLCSRRFPRELQATPITITSGFEIKEGSDAVAAAAAAGLAPELPTWISGVGNLTFFNLGDGMELSIDEMESMRLLLEIKNGIPPVEKIVLLQIAGKAREFGAGSLFDKILPLPMERTPEDQERHSLVKALTMSFTDSAISSGLTFLLSSNPFL